MKKNDIWGNWSSDPRGALSTDNVIGAVKRLQSKSIKRALFLGAVAMSGTSPVWGQDVTDPSLQNQSSQANGEGLADIVVTAQKRATNVQETPLAVTAVSGEDLAARQVNDFERLAPSLPSVNFGRNVGFARIAIRGLGFDATSAGQEGRVAFHSDGVYVSRPTAQLAGFFDVNRVEVVRGPQGTLYGRNATAGAVNVITNNPQNQFAGLAKLTVGNHSHIQTEGFFTGPVSDTVSARIAFQTVDNDGYGDNITTGENIDNEHSFAVRGKVKIEPSSKFDLVLAAEYSHSDDNNFVYHHIGAGRPGVVPFGPALGGIVPPNPRDSSGNVPQRNVRRFSAFTATMNWDVGFATLTSITGYRDSNTQYQSDSDGTSAPVARVRINEIARQFSEELRLAGDIGDLSYILGGYYFREELFGQSNFSPFRSPASGQQTQGIDYIGDFDTRAYAAFGQFDWRPVTGLTLSAGIRYSYEKRAIDQMGVADLVTPYDPSVPYNHNLSQVARTSFDSFTPRFGIDFQATDDIMLYATYAKGFKSGGFALSAFTGDPLRPEKLTDYEGGIKTEWFDRRLRINLSAFYYDYTDLQVQRLLGNQSLPVNAASAKVKGIEVEFVASPIDGLEITGNGSILDTKFTTFFTSEAARPELGVQDLSGNRLPQAPPYTANLAVQYTKAVGGGEITGRVEGAWTGRVYFSPYNRPETSQAAYGKYNASLTWDMGNGLSLAGFVRNIANKRTISTSQVSIGALGFPVLGAFDPLRTFGGSLSYRF
ncbi:MAG TPA: TonB-dependent receptor [Rhizorhapis sp.]|nr:TonB-dependent receptor [Rhizorhapis sp.]